MLKIEYYSVYCNSGTHMGILPRAEALKYFTELRHRNPNAGSNEFPDYHAYPVLYPHNNDEQRQFCVEFEKDFETVDTYFKQRHYDRGGLLVTSKVGVGEGGRMILVKDWGKGFKFFHSH